MTGSIRFTESMRGQVTGPAPFSGTPLALLGLQVAVSSRPVRGMEGMRGRITAGRVRVPCLSSDALEVTGGTIEILRKVSAHACEMRYVLHCQLPGGIRQFRLHGVKDVSHHSGLLWPRAIWVEPTTLKLAVVELPDPGQPDAARAAPAIAGVVVIRARDFARQLASFRSVNPLGRWNAILDLLHFLRFFVLRLQAVYWRR